jgi:UDP-N-acetyl-D-mannosaminuronic acid dehydrogenase
LVERLVADLGLDIDVAFCPERIAEGKAMVELFELPQIVASRSPRALERAGKLFRNLAHEIVELEPEEAELAKLFTNTWRYIKFAASNQLYMMANDFGLDYERIRTALSYNYPRAADLPRAGFAAGPCLFKDTMPLAAFNTNNFHLGQASVSINEGLPLYVVARLEQRYDLSTMCVGVLGMSFKAESDDIRSSLSYKLKRILKFKSKRVLTHDPYVTNDPDLVDLETQIGDQALDQRGDAGIHGAAEHEQLAVVQRRRDVGDRRRHRVEIGVQVLVDRGADDHDHVLGVGDRV